MKIFSKYELLASFLLFFFLGPSIFAQNYNSYISTSRSTNDWGVILSTWTVPPAPDVDNGQFVAIWPGLVGYGLQSSVLQPTLSWSGIDGWGISSWNCCGVSSVESSKKISVRSGDAILGVISQDCNKFKENCGIWTISVTDLNNGKSTALKMTQQSGLDISSLYSAYLETQYLNSCSELPSNTEILLTTIAFNYEHDQLTLNWLPGVDGNDVHGASETVIDCKWKHKISGNTFILGYESGKSVVPSFFIEAKKARVNLSKNSRSIVSIEMSPRNGFNEKAAVHIYGLPQGVNAILPTEYLEPYRSTAVQFMATEKSLPGIYPISIWAKSSNQSAALPLLLNID